MRLTGCIKKKRAKDVGRVGRLEGSRVAQGESTGGKGERK